MGTLAFVCAMPMEMRPLAKRLELEKGEVGGVKVRTGTLDGEPVVGFVTGMGTDLATKGIDRLLAAVRPERVVVFGITGAVEDETPIGTVMMPALVIDHATGRTHEHHPPGGEATAGRAVDHQHHDAGRGAARPHRAGRDRPRHGDRRLRAVAASARACPGRCTGRSATTPRTRSTTSCSPDEPGRHAELGQHRRATS